MKSFLPLIFIAFSFTGLADEVDCEDPQTTIETNICANIEAKAAQTEMDSYLAKAIEKYSSELKTIEALKHSQEAWLTYRKAYCDAVYELWSMGTIRGAMYNGCMIDLTKERTKNIWSDYLTFADSTEPLLPEPK